MSDSWVEFRVSVVPEVVDELTVALNEFENQGDDGNSSFPLYLQ